MRIAVYPGTFDPVTNGHIDIVNRALKLFDKVIVAVSENPMKEPLFTVEERKEMLRKCLKGNVEVESFNSLLVDYYKKKKAGAIVRGMRAASDFDLESTMAAMNKNLDKDIETVFLMAGKEYFFLSSGAVRQVAKLGGNLNSLVPNLVEKKLKEKYGSR